MFAVKEGNSLKGEARSEKISSAGRDLVTRTPRA